MDARLSQLEKFQVLDHLSSRLPFTPVEAFTSHHVIKLWNFNVYGEPSCDIHDSSELVICMLHARFLGRLITTKKGFLSLTKNKTPWIKFSFHSVPQVLYLL